MQIIISPLASGHENFLLDVEGSIDIAALRAQAGARIGVPAERVKLVFEGIELADGTALGEYHVLPLSTIRLVAVDAHAHTAPVGEVPAGHAHAASAGAPDDQQVIRPEEMPAAIAVMGIPTADPATTEKALFDAFSRYGHMARVLFQDNGAAGGTGQRAIIVFQREASAAAALGADGSTILGAPVRVGMASTLARDAGVPMGVPVGTAVAAPGTGRVEGTVSFRFFDARGSRAVAHWIAQGYLYGMQGVAHLRQYDAEHGLSQRVKVFTENIAERTGELNTRYRIVPTVQATYDRAAAQAAELDRTYRIRANLEEAGQQALAAAAELAQRAMTNPQIARTVTAAKSFIEQAAAAIESTYNQAREEVRGMQPPAAAAPMALPPAAPAAAAPHGVPPTALHAAAADLPAASPSPTSFTKAI